MATNDSWGRRLRDAKRDYEKRHDTRLSYAEIGARVSAMLGRDRPFASTSVRSWFVDGQEPEAFAITAALAEVLETQAGALAFGEPEVAAAYPLIDPARDRKLSQEEIDRARAEVAAAKAATSPTAKKRGNHH